MSTDDARDHFEFNATVAVSPFCNDTTMVISLIGYRGTGKSTVAAQLAERLGWEFIDTDPLIEQQAGCSIATIFQEQGEPAFRQLEQSVLFEQLERTRLVIAAGGGMILNAENRQRLRNAGPVVWLEASVETIAERLNSDPTTAERRPALSGASAIEEIEAVLAQRYPLYAETASIRILTDHLSPEVITDAILGQLPKECRT